MGKKAGKVQGKDPQNTFKYGMPVYGLVWPEGDVFYICGGGGHGIKNRLVYAEAQETQLTDQVGEFTFGDDCPTRMVLTPNGKSLVCVMSKGIRRLELDTRGKVPKVAEVTGLLAERLAQTCTLEVTCLAFSPSGDALALGCEDGSLLVYEWPGLTPKMQLTGDKKFPKAVSDVDFSRSTSGASTSSSGRSSSSSASARQHTARILAVVLDGGAAELWDVDQAKQLCRVQLARGQFKSDKVLQVTAQGRLVLQHLPKGMEGATFKRMRFCRGGSGKLYALMNHRDACYVTAWSVGEDGMMAMSAHVKAATAAAPCMDVTADGSKIAVATAEGDVVVIACAPKLAVVRKRSAAHMVFCTNIAFSADGQRVLSASGDASVSVTDARGQPKKPISVKQIYMACVLLLMVLVLLFKLYTLVLVSHYNVDPRYAKHYAMVRLGLMSEPQGQCNLGQGGCEL